MGGWVSWLARKNIFNQEEHVKRMRGKLSLTVRDKGVLSNENR